MGACLHRTAIGDHHDLVGAADGVQAMGDDQDRPAWCQPLDAVVQRGRVLRIQVRAGLVEDQEGRVFEERAREGQPLRLTSAQTCSSLADHGVVAGGQGCDELVRMGQARGGDDRVTRGVGARQEDIGGYGVMKKIRELGDPGHARAPGGGRDGEEGRTVEGDAASIRLQEAQEKVGDRRFAAAARPYQGGDPARRDREGQVGQGGAVGGRIGVINAFEGDGGGEPIAAGAAERVVVRL